MSTTPANSAFYEAEAQVFARHSLKPRTRLLRLQSPRLVGAVLAASTVAAAIRLRVELVDLGLRGWTP